MMIGVSQADVDGAVRNWCEWKDVFEYNGPAADNPLLVDAAKFATFLRRYSVYRTIRSGRSENLRILLRDPQFPLNTILDDATGLQLDTQEFSLREQFGTRDGRRGLRAALSKIAAFLASHRFIAWDKYARKGLKKVLQRHSVKNYAEYLEGANALLSGELGERVRDACNNKYPTQYAAELDRFHRRVLDRYLMRTGGRPKQQVLEVVVTEQ